MQVLQVLQVMPDYCISEVRLVVLCMRLWVFISRVLVCEQNCIIIGNRFGEPISLNLKIEEPSANKNELCATNLASVSSEYKNNRLMN